MTSYLARLAGAVLINALSWGAAAAQTAAPAKLDVARGQAIATQVCAACHTVDGSRGVAANPILQGQHPEYMVKQLTEFKADKRPSAIMKPFASALTEADMRNVAAFYATKQAKPGFASNKELVSLGEQIYRGGIAERQVPACAGCHNPTGAGIPAQYPRLGGQHAGYTEAQMRAFRARTRPNSAQMIGVASKMNDREIQAVSDYIAGLQ
jgi:cytochrome c553